MDFSRKFAKKFINDGGSLQSKSMNWLLYDKELRHEGVKNAS